MSHATKWTQNESFVLTVTFLNILKVEYTTFNVLLYLIPWQRFS